MKFDLFIQSVLQNIREGIVKFNRDSDCLKAEMPPVIEFDLAVHFGKEGVEVVNYYDQSPCHISRLKISIDVLNYPGWKDKNEAT